MKMPMNQLMNEILEQQHDALHEKHQQVRDSLDRRIEQLEKRLQLEAGEKIIRQQHQKCQIEYLVEKLKVEEEQNCISQKQMEKRDRQIQRLKDKGEGCQLKLDQLKRKALCAVCLDRSKKMIFLCGHGACETCGNRLTNCSICRKRIEKRIPLYD